MINKLSIDVLKEWAETDSISKMNQMEKLIVDKIHEYIMTYLPLTLSKKDINQFSWYFPDAPEGDVGTLNSGLIRSDVALAISEDYTIRLNWYYTGSTSLPSFISEGIPLSELFDI